jgi:hypothetical protein
MSSKSSARILFVANSIITIAFGIVTLWNPALTAQQMGFRDYDAGHLILLRGYASAALGYGMIMVLLSNVSHPDSKRGGLLLASAAFNGAETIVQGHHWLVTTTTNNDQNHPNMIKLDVLPTLIYHGLLFLWSIMLLVLPPKETSPASGKTKEK